jgi:hypothetical protein
MFNKLVCYLFGHIEGGKASCPFTDMTYITCNRCNQIYDSYETI